MTAISTNNLDSKAAALVDTADNLDVVDERTYVAACGFLREIKQYRRLVEEAFGPIVVKAHDAWKAAVAQKRKYDEPADRAEKCVKEKIGVWQASEERRRREEEERQRAEARKAAEAERARIAAAAAASGFEEAVEVVEAEPIKTPVVVLPPPVKVAGVSARTAWRWRIVDEAAIPREYLIVDEKKINGVVRAMKDKTSIPGIEVYSEKVVAAR